jgi:hypothetical protein
MLSFSVIADIDVNTYTISKDFSILTNTDTVNMCACASRSDFVTVQNTGTFGAVFTVDVSSGIPYTLPEKSFELAPGDSKNVYIYYNAACSKKSATATITITSNLGVTKSVTKSIVADRCQNIEMWFTGNDQTINACDKAAYTVYVKNVGPFTDTYAVSSDNPVLFSASTFELQPNQIALINASLNLGCSVSGDKNVTFTAQSLKNRLQTSATSILHILPDYDYGVQIYDPSQPSNYNSGNNFDVCNRLSYTPLAVKITNKGIANNFTISTKDLPQWISISEKNFNLARGESKIIYLGAYTAKFDRETNSYGFDVTVQPTIGFLNTQHVTVNLKPCYDHSVTIVGMDKNSKSNPVKVCEDSLYGYDVAVSNTGIKDQIVNLSLADAPSDFSLSSQNVFVQAGETKNVKLYLIGPANNRLLNPKIYASLESGFIAFDDMWIQSYDSESCHNIMFKNSVFHVNYDAKEITAKIVDKSVEPGNYSIDWKGSFIADLKTTNLHVDATGKTYSIPLSLNTQNMSQGTYNGTLIIKHDASRTTYMQDVQIILKDKSCVQKSFEFLAFGTPCRQVSLYLIIAIIIVILVIIGILIWGPKYPYKFWNRVKSKTPALVLLIVVFLVALGLVIILAGLPKTHTEVYNITTNASALRFEWLQNDKYVLDVSTFFTDPDANMLSYNVSTIQGITSSVQKNKITFYPNPGFSGTKYATITAYDKYGGSVESPEITLSVIPLVKKTPVELYNIYCWYINLGLFLIFLACIFLAVVVKQKKRTRKNTAK